LERKRFRGKKKKKSIKKSGKRDQKRGRQIREREGAWEGFASNSKKARTGKKKKKGKFKPRPVCLMSAGGGGLSGGKRG